MRRGVAVTLVIATFAACALYGPSLLVAPDSGTDATTDGGVYSSCDSATWPARPVKDDPPTYDGGELVLALQAIDFDPDAGSGSLKGWDLDHTCTCPGRPSCNPTGDARVACDDPNGRDNAAGVLLSNFTAFASALFDSATLNQKLKDGKFDFLVRVKDYNGTKNDTQVTVAIFISGGMNGIQDGGMPMTPKFDGTDEWTVDPGSLFGGTGPPYVPLPDSVDTMAYVVDGMLVAVLNQVRLVLAGSSAAIGVDLSGCVVTGHLTSAPSGFFQMKDGVISGRWATRRMLGALSGVKDPLKPGGYLCGDSGTYAQIKRLICDARDIVAAVQNDNTNAYCDSLSIALGFAALPARMGTPWSGGPLPAPCGPQWDDDCSK